MHRFDSSEAGVVVAGLEQAISAGLHDSGILSEPIERIRSNSGKRLRPRVLLGFAGLAGDRTEADCRAAAALEIIHEGSLAHDDIVDRSLVRRKRPSTPAEFGCRSAGNVGVYLVAKGLATLARLEAGSGLQIDLHLVRDLARAQMLERLPLEATYPAQRALAIEVIDGKTGGLFRLAAQLGCALANARRAGVADPELADEYAVSLARGFQIRDDVLDLNHDSRLGRPGGCDLPNGTLGWPMLEWAGLQRSWTSACARIRGCRTNPRDQHALRSEVLASRAVALASAQANSFLDRAAVASRRLPPSPGRSVLSTIVDELLF